jgi:hypothetical protein
MGTRDVMAKAGEAIEYKPIVLRATQTAEWTSWIEYEADVMEKTNRLLAVCLAN